MSFFYSFNYELWYRHFRICILLLNFICFLCEVSRSFQTFDAWYMYSRSRTYQIILFYFLPSKLEVVYEIVYLFLTTTVDYFLWYNFSWYWSKKHKIALRKVKKWQYVYQQILHNYRQLNSVKDACRDRTIWKNC